ncbi:MAG: glycosyltransferase, partial [Myxococcales bacterium]
MRIVIFGLTVSSSWGNGHATLWRGLLRSLGAAGHEVTFFEKDVPYYASNRDCLSPEGCRLVLYPAWREIESTARAAVAAADVAMVTSYCPDALAATELVVNQRRARPVFYDLDTPVTLDRLAAGEAVEYVGPDGLRGFDLVLSYTGGFALSALQTLLGARSVAPLYGSVDPQAHSLGEPAPQY